MSDLSKATREARCRWLDYIAYINPAVRHMRERNEHIMTSDVFYIYFGPYLQDLNTLEFIPDYAKQFETLSCSTLDDIENKGWAIILEPITKDHTLSDDQYRELKEIFSNITLTSHSLRSVLVKNTIFT
jgi:hypothetical protein